MHSPGRTGGAGAPDISHRRRVMSTNRRNPFLRGLLLIAALVPAAPPRDYASPTAPAGEATPAGPVTVIVHASVLDGTGSPARKTNVRISGDLIVDVGGAVPAAGEAVVDAAGPEEVVELAKTAASFGGRYISHIRSEDRYFWKAIDEIIEIGRQAKLPVQISHTKLAMRSWWGQADKLLARLDKARASGVDITADMYPYLYWESTLTVLFPGRDFENRAEASLVLKEIAAPEGLLLTQFGPEPSYAGRTVAEIARLRRSDPVTTLIDLIRMSEAMRKETGESVESVIGTSMQEPDVERLMTWRSMNFCTDGYLEGPHPRGFGSYPRILGHYVRERRLLTLPQAVRPAPALAAAHMR